MEQINNVRIESSAKCGVDGYLLEVINVRGERREIFVDGYDFDQLPSYPALFSFGLSWCFSESLDRGIACVEWYTCIPTFEHVQLTA